MMDWVKIAKLAGKHGVRYANNNSLEAFLLDISSHEESRPTPEMIKAGEEAYWRKRCDMTSQTPTEEPGIGPIGYAYLAMRDIAFREGFKAGSRGGQPIGDALASFSGSSAHGLLDAMIAVAPAPPPWSAEQVEAISSFALDFYKRSESSPSEVERAQRIVDDMVSELVHQLGETGIETDKLITPDEIRAISDGFAALLNTTERR